MYFELFDEYTAGVRPNRLYEVSARQKVQRHTVGQIFYVVFWLPTLDVLVLQMVEQPVVILRSLDFALPEQVIAMPKISSTPPRSARSSLSRSWRNSWWKCLSLSIPSTTGSVGKHTGSRLQVVGWLRMAFVPSDGIYRQPRAAQNIGHGRRPWYLAALDLAVQVVQGVHRQIRGKPRLRLVRTGQFVQKTRGSTSAG